MKAVKIISLVIPILLCLVMVVVPIYETIAFSNGLDFALYNENAVVWTQAGLSFCALVALLIMKPQYGIAGKIFCMLLAPISLWNALCFVVSEWNFSILVSVIWIVCTFTIFLVFIPDSFFKAMSAVVSVLLAIALVLLYLVFGIFEPVLSQVTVEESYTSPNGEYVAEMSTVKTAFSEKAQVTVHKINPSEYKMLGQYSKKPIDIYEGEAHETHTANVSWKDDSTIIINGTEYEVNFG